MPMHLWIGIKKGEKYVHEWTGDIPEDEIPDAVQQALIVYGADSNESLWDVTIKVDKCPKDSDPS
jgi:hypothetical protein